MKTKPAKKPLRVMLSIRLPKSLLGRIAAQAKIQKVHKTRLIERILTARLSPKEYGIRVDEGSI